MFSGQLVSYNHIKGAGVGGGGGGGGGSEVDFHFFIVSNRGEC